MTLLLLFMVSALLAAPASCCRDKEFRTNDGQCCPMCHEGKVVTRDCTAESGTLCAACEAGTYMNQPNGLKKCFPCTSCDAAHGLFTQISCSSTSDSVCDVLSGFFCKSLSGTGCNHAEKHSDCKSGQGIKQPGTSRTDTVCEECQHGSFSLNGVNCTLWTKCFEIQTEVQEGSSTSDVVCRNGATRHHYFMILSLFLCLLTVGWIVYKGRFQKQSQNETT